MFRRLCALAAAALCSGVSNSTDCSYTKTPSDLQVTSHYERNEGKARVLVFVHGLSGDPAESWTCPKTGISWPKLLLDDKAFNDSDIYVAGYTTRLFGNHMTLVEVVGNLVNRLENDRVFEHHEVVFIAHSLGGLVVRKLLLTYRDFSKKVRFIYFFSTPQSGAEIA